MAQIAELFLRRWNSCKTIQPVQKTLKWEFRNQHKKFNNRQLGLCYFKRKWNIYTLFYTVTLHAFTHWTTCWILLNLFNNCTTKTDQLFLADHLKVYYNVPLAQPPGITSWRTEAFNNGGFPWEHVIPLAVLKKHKISL